MRYYAIREKQEEARRNAETSRRATMASRGELASWDPMFPKTRDGRAVDAPDSVGCPHCGATPRVELAPCPAARLDPEALDVLTDDERTLVLDLVCPRVDGHRHGKLYAPACRCWDGSDAAPAGQFWPLERLEHHWSLRPGWGSLRDNTALRRRVSSPVRAVLIVLALGPGFPVPDALRVLADRAKTERTADERAAALEAAS